MPWICGLKEICRHCKISYPTFYRWTKRYPGFPVLKVGHSLRTTSSLLDEFLANIMRKRLDKIAKKDKEL